MIFLNLKDTIGKQPGGGAAMEGDEPPFFRQHPPPLHYPLHASSTSPSYLRSRRPLPPIVRHAEMP